MGREMPDKNSKNKVTDWRIIGVSGDTMDGRQISADELKQMAESYDPAVYGARINLEHCYYTFPGWAGGYGDVLELKAEPWHKDESRTALLARLSVLPNLQELWDEGEKIYTSMEIAPDFAKSGRAYLVGLAITDRPASLGTTANFSVAAAQAEKGKTFTPYHLDGITAAGTVQADDRIAATVIVWMIDCGLLDEAMPLADVLIHSGLESADEYSRSMPEIIVEQMAEQIESGSEISAENLKTLIEWATAKKEDGLHEINLADVIRAKLLKAAGEKAEAADDNETALTLCPGCMSGCWVLNAAAKPSRTAAQPPLGLVSITVEKSRRPPKRRQFIPSSSKKTGIMTGRLSMFWIGWRPMSCRCRRAVWSAGRCVRSTAIVFAARARNSTMRRVCLRPRSIR